MIKRNVLAPPTYTHTCIAQYEGRKELMARFHTSEHDERVSEREFEFLYHNFSILLHTSIEHWLLYLYRLFLFCIYLNFYKYVSVIIILRFRCTFSIFYFSCVCVCVMCSVFVERIHMHIMTLHSAHVRTSTTRQINEPNFYRKYYVFIWLSHYLSLNSVTITCVVLLFCVLSLFILEKFFFLSLVTRLPHMGPISTDVSSFGCFHKSS